MSVVNTVNLGKHLQLQRRNLWQWINLMFNKVDEDRRKIVGPDRSCAEWILRNGGAVKWKMEKEYLKDYNQLPEESVKLCLEEIDATGASIMQVGFPHLVGCDSIKKIIFHKCTYLENDAFKDLNFVKNSLLHLQVSSCPNITDNGLMYLKDLTNLKTLLMFDLPYVKDKSNVSKILGESLPKCNVEFK